jgi:uncharacterized membrane protein YhaH (DUF805 family)
LIFLQPYKKYATFSGRATRKEFWLFHLFYIIGFIVLINIEQMLGTEGGIFILWLFANMIPQIAVGVRRLHDTNKSGWLYLLMLIPLGNLFLLFLFCIGSDEEDNRFGSNPQ